MNNCKRATRYCKTLYHHITFLFSVHYNVWHHFNGHPKHIVSQQNICPNECKMMRKIGKIGHFFLKNDHFFRKISQPNPYKVNFFRKRQPSSILFSNCGDFAIIKYGSRRTEKLSYTHLHSARDKSNHERHERAQNRLALTIDSDSKRQQNPYERG